MTTASPGQPSDIPGQGVGGATPTDSDWTDQVTELIVDSVDKVRVRTTGPVLNVAHASVYALVAAIVAIPVVIALFAGLVRFLNWVIPGDVWIAYLVIAAGMWLIGFVLWQRRAQGSTT